MPGIEPLQPSRKPTLAPAAGASPTVLRLILGAQLRRMRAEAGITPDVAAACIRCSTAKISRMETGHSPCKERDAADLLTLYGVTDPARTAEFLDLVNKAGERGWWRSYADVLPDWFEPLVGLEEAAASIRTYESHYIPGLLQTFDYAYAVVRSGHAIEPEEVTRRRVELRLKRQDLLYRSDPPKLWVLLDEAVLMRPTGGRQVMREQLSHLLDMTELPHVIVQVAPFEVTAHTSPGSGITYLRFAMAQLPDVAYLEHLTNATSVTKRESTDEYRWILDSLSAQSPSPVESRRLLRQALERYG
ncbi:XRE family transcriptional regulator [Streptomyces nitrosporeus]|uniref:XRE family transcriptional regulator n=1 Tax=Streptomyces nitrosporeus TaxID=28894 RepID=A0A5J6FMP5_9ACTN|nr:helix-turn-helix transcriptional regulator [Streptomyces nitrosporeus]QEU76235.1 XRE family transcriptional regulator [Streptomyces nitrosporeus]GGZ21742.1 transcriptional regulator [Streptomyces nitrosporeus]